MKKGFHAFMERVRFDPGLAGVFLNPFYFARSGLWRHIRALAPQLSGKVLDVGCGSKPYRRLIQCDQYDGLEIDTPRMRSGSKAEYFYDGTTFPFADGSYDGVLANQVLEHVFEPDRFVAEISRVLRRGGRLLLTVPFVWDEHEQPVDYARYSSFGVKHLLEKHGLRVVASRKSHNDASVVFQLITGAIYKATATKNLYVNIFWSIVMSPITILGIIIAGILPHSRDLYLDNVVLAEKI